MKDTIIQARDCGKDQRRNEKKNEADNCKNHARREGGVYDNADCEGCTCSVIRLEYDLAQRTNDLPARYSKKCICYVTITGGKCCSWNNR